ncbi:hypothetical protein COOONC_13731 [Cooperia oncophora]
MHLCTLCKNERTSYKPYTSKYRNIGTIEKHSPGVQTMLFSATYGEDVVKFAMQLIKNAVTVT